MRCSRVLVPDCSWDKHISVHTLSSRQSISLQHVNAAAVGSLPLKCKTCFSILQVLAHVWRSSVTQGTLTPSLPPAVRCKWNDHQQAKNTIIFPAWGTVITSDQTCGSSLYHYRDIYQKNIKNTARTKKVRKRSLPCPVQQSENFFLAMQR